MSPVEKMINSWMQSLKDAVYAAEQFFNEKKPTQYTHDVARVQTFAAILLHNVMDEQIGEQLSLIVTNKSYHALMSKGLIMKPGDKLVPGVFFKEQGPAITIQHSGAPYSLGINEMLKSITEHGRRTDNMAKSHNVNLFVASSLAKMFTTYITQCGVSIGMSRADREIVVSNTVIESVTPPYVRGQRMSALKGVLSDGLASPAIREMIERHIGSAGTQAMKSAIDGFDGSSVNTLHTAFADALAKQKAAPIYDAVVKVVTAATDSIHIEDGVKAYDQE